MRRRIPKLRPRKPKEEPPAKKIKSKNGRNEDEKKNDPPVEIIEEKRCFAYDSKKKEFIEKDTVGSKDIGENKKVVTSLFLFTSVSTQNDELIRDRDRITLKNGEYLNIKHVISFSLSGVVLEKKVYERITSFDELQSVSLSNVTLPRGVTLNGFLKNFEKLNEFHILHSKIVLGDRYSSTKNNGPITKFSICPMDYNEEHLKTYFSEFISENKTDKVKLYLKEKPDQKFLYHFENKLNYLRNDEQKKYRITLTRYGDNGLYLVDINFVFVHDKGPKRIDDVKMYLEYDNRPRFDVVNYAERYPDGFKFTKLPLTIQERYLELMIDDIQDWCVKNNPYKNILHPIYKFYNYLCVMKKDSDSKLFTANYNGKKYSSLKPVLDKRVDILHFYSPDIPEYGSRSEFLRFGISSFLPEFKELLLNQSIRHLLISSTRFNEELFEYELFENLRSLTIFRIEVCPNLRDLFRNLQRIEKIHIEDCVCVAPSYPYQNFFAKWEPKFLTHLFISELQYEVDTFSDQIKKLLISLSPTVKKVILQVTRGGSSSMLLTEQIDGAVKMNKEVNDALREKGQHINYDMNITDILISSGCANQFTFDLVDFT